MAEFAPKSATFGVWPTNGFSLLRKASVGWFLWLYSAEGSMLKTGRSSHKDLSGVLSCVYPK